MNLILTAHHCSNLAAYHEPDPVLATNTAQWLCPLVMHNGPVITYTTMDLPLSDAMTVPLDHAQSLCPLVMHNGCAPESCTMSLPLSHAQWPSLSQQQHQSRSGNIFCTLAQRLAWPVPRLSLAALMMVGSRPRPAAMLRALERPGTPHSRRYVGASFCSSNSTLAFSKALFSNFRDVKELQQQHRQKL